MWHSLVKRSNKCAIAIITFFARLANAAPTFKPEFRLLPLCFPIFVSCYATGPPLRKLICTNGSVQLSGKSSAFSQAKRYHLRLPCTRKALNSSCTNLLLAFNERAKPKASPRVGVGVEIERLFLRSALYQDAISSLPDYQTSTRSYVNSTKPCLLACAFHLYAHEEEQFL